MLKKLDELIDKFVGMGIPSIDILVLHHGEEIYRRMEGYSDPERTKPINGTERYNIYSCSKPITVTAAMQLWEKGSFSLDDKLSDYMPEFAGVKVLENGMLREPKRQIVIRDLFTMSAGFTYDLWSTENMKLVRRETGGRCPTRETMKYIARDPLIFDPGERYNYSLCHDIIAALVEVIAGESFGEYVKRNIFDPLGMNSSTFLPSDEEINALSAQYSYNNETKTYDYIGGKNGYRIGSEYESGGAGCVTTVNDYIKFLEGWRTDRLLKPETLELMTTNQLDDTKRTKQYGVSGYGYGLGLRCKYAADKTDFGWGGAAGAFLACDKVNDFTVFHVQQVLNSPNQSLRILIPSLIREDLKSMDRSLL